MGVTGNDQGPTSNLKTSVDSHQVWGGVGGWGFGQTAMCQTKKERDSEATSWGLKTGIEAGRGVHVLKPNQERKA